MIIFNNFAAIKSIPMGKKATSFLIYGLSILLTSFTAVITIITANSGLSSCTSAAASFTILLLPVLILVNLLFALYWLLRKRWIICLIPLAAVAGSFPYYGTIYKWAGKPDTEFSVQKESEENIRVLTYNTGNFLNKDNIKCARTLADFLNSQAIDIACFQEYSMQGRFKDTVAKIMGNFPYAVSNADNEQMKVAVYSRYPILESSYVSYPASTYGYIVSTIAICDREKLENEIAAVLAGLVMPEQNDSAALFRRDSVTRAVTDSITGVSPKIILINTHLQTTGISATNIDVALTKRAGGDINQAGRTGMAVSRMSDGYKKRAQQIESISELIKNAAWPVILCGDFNETPLSYVYDRSATLLTDGFKEGGSGYMYTYKYFKKLLRIDYIFHSAGLRSVRYFSPDKPFSDHNPVISELERIL